MVLTELTGLLRVAFKSFRLAWQCQDHSDVEFLHVEVAIKKR